jgi:hypothetical protein
LTAAFHFCFEVIRAAITRSLSATTKSKSPADDLDDDKKSPVLKGLSVINEHAMMRGNPDEDDKEVPTLFSTSILGKNETF